MRYLPLQTMHATAAAALAAKADAATVAAAAATVAAARDAVAAATGHDATAKLADRRPRFIVGAHIWAADAGETADAHRRIVANFRAHSKATADFLRAAARGQFDAAAVAAMRRHEKADPATAAAAHPNAAALAAAHAADLDRVPSHALRSVTVDRATADAKAAKARRHAIALLADADKRDRRAGRRKAADAAAAGNAATLADASAHWRTLAATAATLADVADGIAPAAKRALRVALAMAAANGPDDAATIEAVHYALTLAPTTGARTSIGANALAAYVPLWRALAAAAGDDVAAAGFWGQRDTVSAHVGLSLAADDGRRIVRDFDRRHGWRADCADAATGTRNPSRRMIDPDWI